MVLYAKVAFHQFKKGQKLPEVNPKVAKDLLDKGLATKTKPKSNAKGKQE